MSTHSHTQTHTHMHTHTKVFRHYESLHKKVKEKLILNSAKTFSNKNKKASKQKGSSKKEVRIKAGGS